MDLLRVSVFASGMLKTTDTLKEMEETKELFKCLLFQEYDHDTLERCETIRPFAPVLCAYMAPVLSVVLPAAALILMPGRKKKA